VGHRLGDVFEMHGLAFYEDPNGDYGVEGAGGGCGFPISGKGECREVCGA
jgi:hypothetical protein